MEWMKKHKTLSKKIAACGVFGFALLSVMVYLWGDLFVTEFQADVTDTLLWAKAAVQSGHLVDSNFFYPYAIPFGGQILMMPFYPWFGLSLTTIRAGMTLFTVVLALVYMAFFDRVVFHSVWKALCASGVLLLLFLNNIKLREIMYAHVIHYSLAVLFLLLLLTFLSLVFRSAKQVRAKRMLPVTLLGATFFFCAADGTGTLVLSVVPILSACVLERMIHVWILKRPYPEIKRDMKVLAFVAVMAVLGFGVYRWMQRDVYTPYSSLYAGLVPMNQWLKNTIDAAKEWTFKLFRPVLYTDTLVGAHDLSVEGRCCQFFEKWFMFLSPFVLLALSLARYARLETRGERVTLLAFWVLAGITWVLYACTPLKGQNWRMVPVLAMMFVSYAVLIGNLMRSQKKIARVVRMTLTGVIMTFAVIAGVGVLVAKTEADIWTEEGSLIDTLKKNGLTHGFCDEFQFGPTTEVLTNGEIQIKYVNPAGGKLYPLMYQNEMADFDLASEDGRYFLVMTVNNANAIPNGGELLFKGATFAPSYDRQSDRHIFYMVYVYDHCPLESYYVVAHDSVALDRQGNEYPIWEVYAK